MIRYTPKSAAVGHRVAEMMSLMWCLGLTTLHRARWSWHLISDVIGSVVCFVYLLHYYDLTELRVLWFCDTVKLIV